MKIALLPKHKDEGWAPYVWLAYLVFFLINPTLDHASLKEWAYTLLALGVFLLFYFRYFWVECKGKLLCIAGITALGVAYAPYNGGACTFFIYAGALTPFAVETELSAVEILAAIVFIPLVEWRLLHLSTWFVFYASGFSLVLGLSNIYFAQRNRTVNKLRMAGAEIERLAKVAERERIARDLHDVLGHTLSVIILKSELAQKLIDRDPARARDEMADVENTSRAALADVRSTIRGYRAVSLRSELLNARATLETAGVAVTDDSEEVPLTPAQESVVALIVREAVTNVVRHAGAKHCSLSLAPRDGHCVLEIMDDGRGGAYSEGVGLQGMRERVEALEGTLQRDTTSGTRITARFPLTHSAVQPQF